MTFDDKLHIPVDFSMRIYWVACLVVSTPNLLSSLSTNKDYVSWHAAFCRHEFRNRTRIWVLINGHLHITKLLMFVSFLICSFMHGGQLDCAHFLWITVNSRVKLCPRLAQFGCIYIRLSSICVSIQFQINGLMQERRNFSALDMELRIVCTTPIGIISHYPPCIFGYMLSWTVVPIYCLQKVFTYIILRTRHSVIAPSPWLNDIYFSPECCLLTVIYIPACRNLSLLTFEKGILDFTFVSNAYIIFNHCCLLWNRNLIHNYGYIYISTNTVLLSRGRKLTTADWQGTPVSLGATLHLFTIICMI